MRMETRKTFAHRRLKNFVIYLTLDGPTKENIGKLRKSCATFRVEPLNPAIYKLLRTKFHQIAESMAHEDVYITSQCINWITNSLNCLPNCTTRHPSSLWRARAWGSWSAWAMSRAHWFDHWSRAINHDSQMKTTLECIIWKSRLERRDCCATFNNLRQFAEDEDALQVFYWLGSSSLQLLNGFPLKNNGKSQDVP